MKSFKSKALVLIMLLAVIIAGCSSSSDTPVASNTETMRVLEIAPTITGTPELKAGVEPLPEFLKTRLSAVKEDTTAGTSEMVFDLAAGETFDRSVGDIFVLEVKTNITGDYPYPFKKITGITTSSNKYTVKTVDVPLEEVFQNLDVEFTQDIGPDDVQVKSLARGVQLSPVQKAIVGEKTISFDLNKEIYKNDNVTVSTVGNVKMTLKVFFRLSIEEGKIYGFGTSLISKQKSSFGLKATGEWEGEKDFSMGTVFSAKLNFVVPVGPFTVPLWVDVKIPLNLGVSASVKAQSETIYTREDQGTVGVLYNGASSSWFPINTYDSSENFTPPTLSGSSNISIFMGPKLETALYSLVGPWITLYGSLGLTADGDVAKIVMPTGYEWETRTGLKSEAGVDFEKLKEYVSPTMKKLEITLLDPTVPGITNRQLANGPALDSINLGTDSITLLPAGVYNLEEFIDVKGLFDKVEHKLSYDDSRLTLAANAGTIAGNVYTAPAVPGSYTITYSYSYKNKFASAETIATTKTCELSVTVREPKALASVAIDPSSASVTASATLNLAGITVTAKYTDSSEATVSTGIWSIVTGSGSIAGNTYTAPAAAGNATLRVTYTEGGVTKTADLAVTINDSSSGGGGDDGGGGSVITLTNNVPSQLVSGNAGDAFDFKITVPAGQSFLVIGTADGSSATGSIKTYVKFGAPATIANYFSDSIGSEVGNGTGITNPQAGDWYVRIVGLTNFTNFFAQAEFFEIPAYNLIRHVDSGGNNTRTTISTNDAAILIYEFSNEEINAIAGKGSFSIGITNVDLSGVFWSFSPKGLPGFDSSWDNYSGNSNQFGSDVVIGFNDTSKFEGKSKIYVFIDDDAMTGSVSALGETITNN